ncbi:MAG: ATP-grasp domain-containing protein [Bacteroidota bacterium]
MLLFNANQRTLLFSSAGRRIDLIKRFRRASLELEIETRLLGIDCDPTAPATKYVDRFFEVPAVDEPDFGTRVQDILREESVTDVFPLIHPEIPYWAKTKEQFEVENLHIWVGSSRFVELARDKQATKSWLKKNDFQVPELVAPGKAGAAVEQKVIVKPRFGCQSLGIRVLDEHDFWPNFDLDSEQWVVEEFIEGQEYTIDVFTGYHGELLAAVPRKRLKIRGGEVIKAETHRDEHLLDQISEMLDQWHQQDVAVSGPFCLQGIKTRDGEFYITEINARFGGGVPLSLQAGVHYPHMILSGKQPEPWKQWNSGVVMHRFDEAMYHRL